MYVRLPGLVKQYSRTWEEIALIAKWRAVKKEARTADHDDAVEEAVAGLNKAIGLKDEMNETVAMLRILAPEPLATIAEEWVKVVLESVEENADDQKAKAQRLESAYLDQVRTDLGFAQPFDETVGESRRQSGRQEL